MLLLIAFYVAGFVFGLVLISQCIETGRGE